MRSPARWATTLCAAALFLAPLIWMLLASFRKSETLFDSQLGSWLELDGWTSSNYAAAWRRAGLLAASCTSFVQVAVIASSGLLVNSLAAFAFARLEFRGRELLFGAVVALAILPVEVLAVPLLFTARDLGLTGGPLAALSGLTLPFAAKAFNIYFMRQHFLSVPRELEEAAALDGASAWHQFWSVSLPAIRPALVTVVLLDLLTHWSDFLWPLLIANRDEARTVQIALTSLFTQPPVDWGAIMACAVMATLPVVALFRLLQTGLVDTDARVGLR